MEKPNSSKTESTVLRNYFWLLLALWTVPVVSILLWSLSHHKHETEEIAHIQAQSLLENDLLRRLWTNSHSGVYALLTERTPANPNRSHITPPSDQTLKLINPAQITHQFHKLKVEQHCAHVHITSLNPLQPANAADEWETKALRSFEQGAKEAYSVEKIHNQDHMRLMHPMIIKQSCLRCHAAQGYKVGDRYGGISISIPMAPIRAVAKENVITLSVGHFILWLLGICGISYGAQRLKYHITEQKSAETSLTIEKSLTIYREKMFQAEQMASLGTIGSAVAHQLNQPLSVIRLSIQKALRDFEKVSCPDIDRELLNDSLDQVSHATSMIKGFLALGHTTSEEKVKTIYIYSVAQQTITAFDEAAKQVQIELIIDNSLKELPSIQGEVREIEQIFFILVQNAIQAADKNTLQYIKISGNVRQEQIELKFSDNCGGIEPGISDKIFEPFFTTKPSSQGTGLGLSILRQILENHNGKVRVENKFGEGTSFFVTFPMQ